MGPTSTSGDAPEPAAQLAQLREALARLARREPVPPDLALDPAAARDVERIGRLIRAARAGALPEDEAVGARRLLVLVKAERYAALRSQMGDRLAAGLLREMQERLRGAFPDARIGRAGAGVVEAALPLAEEAACEKILQAVHAAIEHPFAVGEEVITSPIIVGGAVAEASETFGETLANAEEALARAEAAIGTFALFDRQEKAAASARLALMRDLRAAVRAGDLGVAYQPKLNLRTGEVDGAEALLRWTHAEHGPVSPERFIEMAEDTGDIAPLTEHVLATAVADQARLGAEGARPAVNVNLSGRLLADEGYCRQILSICAAAEGEIGLEITETAVIADPQRSLRNLHAFVEAGLHIAIDDYGSGLSSLAYLKTLPAKELKIDKAFVLGLTSSHRDPLIVRSTIDLAHALEMEVTAEGVDDPAALALLRVMGCDRVQGFHVSRALSLSAFDAFLKAPAPAAWTATGPALGLLRAGR